MMNREWDDLDDDEPDDDYSAEDDRGDAEDDDAETRTCPNCGAEIYEEAEQCPSCGEYVTFDSRAFTQGPLWWTLLGLIGIVAVVCGLLSWAL
jgi:predicted RNA-binding Zn-ribbon protein involved in translation (DUF1610 family)